MLHERLTDVPRREGHVIVESQPAYDPSATGDRGRRRGPDFEHLLVVLFVVALAQVVRVLFPIMFEIGEDWDFLLAGLVALAVFTSPLLALALVRVRSQQALVGGATVIAATLVVVRSVDPIPSAVAIAAVGAALIAVTVVVARARVGATATSPMLVSALVLGLGVDVSLRAAFGSWDLAWQTGAASLVAVIAIGAGLVGTSVFVARSDAMPRPALMAPGFWVALGAYLMLQLLFLSNFAFVGSQADIGYPIAVGVVLAGAAVAVWSVGPTAWARRVGAGWVVGLAAIALAWSLPLSAGAGTVAMIVGLQVSATSLLVWAGRRVPSRQITAAGSVVGAATGSIVFLALVLAWSLHIDQPLPVPRQTLPACAALLIAVTAIRPGAKSQPEQRSPLHAVTWALVGLAVVVPLGLWMTAPSLETAAVARGEINLVSYNTRGSVDTNGQLAPNRIADEIMSSEPNIVVLQEVARGWTIHGTMDLVAYLQRELDMDYVYVPAADGQFGNAIFSNLPMTEIASGTLPKDGSQERAFTVVAIDTPDGVLTVAGTHLQSRSAVQVNALFDSIDATTKLIVAGDMNIAPDDPEAAWFTDIGLVDVVAATGDPCQTTSTEPTSDCDRPDWVLVSPDIAIEDVRIGTGGASDHLATHARLRLGP